jgi:hypothetical protein
MSNTGTDSKTGAQKKSGDDGESATTETDFDTDSGAEKPCDSGPASETGDHTSPRETDSENNSKSEEPPAERLPACPPKTAQCRRR